MAEIWSRPNKEQLKKALRIYSDPLLFWATNVAVETLEKLNPENIDIQENQFGEWIFLTRRLLWKFGLFQVVGQVYNLAEQDAEEYWKNWTPPEIAKIKWDNKMIPSEWRSG